LRSLSTNPTCDQLRRSLGWRQLAFPLVVIVAGIVAYHNSFQAPFLFDDELSIIQNPRLRHLWPLRQVLIGTMRPLVDLSLALNYALDGLRVWGYHAVNLAIHVATALVLLGVVRRVLLMDRLRPRYGGSAQWLALAIAVSWVVHPLHTGAVTYIVQRAELLMGLCYLLVLYATIRSADGQSAVWSAVAILACVCGMTSKPVMVTAPMAALLLDRVFLSGSVRGALRRRRWLYAGLAATWVMLAALVAAPWPVGEPSAGLELQHVTPWAYAATQPGVILHYLRLAVWPSALCLDYAWPPAQTVRQIALALAMVAGLGVATWWTWRRRPALGFLGVWFFLTLAPTSSIIPIADLAVEYRMYLPSIAVVVLGVIGGDVLLRRLLGARRAWRRGCALAAAVGVAMVLAVVTIHRNHDYRSAVVIWSDTVAKRPTNPRAHNNLGLALVAEGRFDEAVARYAEALRLDPTYAFVHNNWGVVLVRQGRLDEAISHLTQAVQLKPTDAKAYANLGVVLAMHGRLEEAMQQYADALRLKPDFPEAHNNLGSALMHRQRFQEAIAHYAEALRLQPDYPQVYNNWGLALAKQGRHAEAIPRYEAAVRMQPNSAEAHHNWGNALAMQGRFADAIEHYVEALRLKPTLAEAHQNWANVCVKWGKLDEAAAHYRQALQVRANYAEAHYNLGVILIKQGVVEEGRQHLATAIRLKPAYRGGDRDTDRPATTSDGVADVSGEPGG